MEASSTGHVGEYMDHFFKGFNKTAKVNPLNLFTKATKAVKPVLKPTKTKLPIPKPKVLSSHAQQNVKNITQRPYSSIG